MSITELIKNLVIVGCLVVGGYVLYQYFAAEPITRTSVEQDQDFDEDSDTAVNLDDCERYTNADNRRACIEARTE